MIEFRSVTKQFPDGTVAVEDFDFVLPSRKTTVFVGSSGCGKTTLLRMINRMVEPTSGEILIDEEDIAAQNKVELRRSIGYVLQSSGLLPHRKVVDNVATVPLLTGVPKAKAREDALDLLDKVGLDRALADRYPRQLSGGQQQRVGVARALASDPNILLMDEPFGAVDPIVRADLQLELNRLQRELGQDDRLRHPRHRRGLHPRRPGGDLPQGRGDRPGRHPGRDPGRPGRRLRGQLHRGRQGQARRCACSSARTATPWSSTVRVGRWACSTASAPRPPRRGTRELDHEQPPADPGVTLNHVRLSIIPIVLSLVLSIPLGWLANRNPTSRAVVITGGSLLYTIPSLPLFVILPLDHPHGDPRRHQPGRRPDHLRRGHHGPVGGRRPGLGRAVDDRRLDGGGILSLGRFWRVELPLAGPVLLAGIRVVSVSTVALVSVGVIIGSENLGYFFQNGKQRGILEEVVVGIVLSLLIALVFDLVIVTLGKVLMPWTRGDGSRSRGGASPQVQWAADVGRARVGSGAG